MSDFNDFLREQIKILERANEESHARLMRALMHAGMEEEDARRWIAICDAEAF